MTADGLLLLLQIDHLSGEEIGALIDGLYGRGARSAQVVPSLTKKGRPGHLALVDASGLDEAALAGWLARAWGISGFHRLPTAHVHHPTASRRVRVRLRAGEREVVGEAAVKVIGDPERPLFARAEHDAIAALTRLAAEALGVEAPLAIRRGLAERLRGGLAAGEVMITLDGAPGS